MKYYLIIPVVAVLLLGNIACKKSNDATDTVRYEVITSKGNWNGVYSIRTNADPIVPETFPMDQSSDWTLSFDVPRNESEYLQMSAVPVDSGAVVTTNIYINGQFVCRGISGNDPNGEADALYVLHGR